MKPSKKTVIFLFLLIASVLIHFYSRGEARVENGYSTRFYPAFARLLRAGFGNIPFSIGDFIYGGFVGWLTWKMIRGVQWLKKKQYRLEKGWVRSFLTSLLIFCGWVYVLFNLFWGINYNRTGIAAQIGLRMEQYDQRDLRELNGLLLEKVNTAKMALVARPAPYPGRSALFERVNRAYQTASSAYPFLQYKPVSIKSSMWGWLGNYTGFTGYYNPFTGEAQVNTTVPAFLQPFITCHEVAHQLGYAKEREANFVGYLASVASADTLLHYSTYLDLFMYANRNLYLADSAAAKTFRKALIPEVKKDLTEWITFSRKHKNSIEPLISWVYDKYLQGNRQPQGVLSYDEVTAFLIAYYKKFGRI